LSRDEFSSKEGQPCDLCVTTYSPDQRTSKICKTKIAGFSQFVNHILSCEKTFGRDLIWTKSEVPAHEELLRPRELGDLTKLYSEPVLKLKFNSFTLVNYQAKLIRYFKLKGCPCSELNTVCGLKSKTFSFSSFFGHLAHVEKNTRQYIVFKASIDEISELDPTYNIQFKIINSNGRAASSSKYTLSSTTDSNNNDSSFNNSLSIDNSEKFDQTETSTSSPVYKSSRSLKKVKRQVTTCKSLVKSKPEKVIKNSINKLINEPSSLISTVSSTERASWSSESNSSSNDSTTNIISTVQISDKRKETDSKQQVLFNGKVVDVWYRRPNDNSSDDSDECDEEIEITFLDGVKIKEVVKGE